jgi:hypothetical protein
MGIRRNRSLAVLRKRRPFGHFAVLIVLAWFFPSLLLAGGFISPGDLSSDHVDLEGITRCTVCHAPFGASVDALIATQRFSSKLKRSMVFTPVALPGVNGVIQTTKVANLNWCSLTKTGFGTRLLVLL